MTIKDTIENEIKTYHAFMDTHIEMLHVYETDRDWHGVADMAMDIRDKQHYIAGLSFALAALMEQE